MNTFSIIIQKRLSSSKQFYFTPTSFTPTTKFEFWNFINKNEIRYETPPTEKLIKLFFYSYITCHEPYTPKTKFEYLKEMLENIFMTDDIRNEVLAAFCKFQKTYHALSRFAFLCKYKRTPIKVDKDMFLNPILENQRNTITILQNGYKYIFTLTDIINIVNTCLGNTEFFFAAPRVIKNPYTNIPFSTAILYNIYYTIKASNFIMPTLFHAFFLENFNRNQYAINNEAIIREYSIKKYVETTSPGILCKEIRAMLKTNFYGKRLHIDIEFPNDVLLLAMRPYLYLYYISNYSVDCSKRLLKQEELEYRLNNFLKHNRLFGRKTIKINKNIVTGKQMTTITFNTDYLQFKFTNQRYVQPNTGVNIIENDESSEDEDE